MSKKTKTSRLFVIGSVIFFVIGLIIFIFFRNLAIDIQLHSTYFVVAYCHLFWLFALILLIFAFMYYLYPKVSSRNMTATLGKLHFYLTTTSMSITLIYTLINIDIPRRFYQFDSFDSYLSSQTESKFIFIVLLLAQLLFIFNLVYSFWKGEKVK